MPTPGLTQRQIDETLVAQSKHPDNKAAAAAFLGISPPTYSNRLKSIARSGGMATETQHIPANENLLATVEKLRDELDRTRQALKDAVRPRFTIRQDNVKAGSKYRGLVIGDAHDSPNIPSKSRFEWIGAHINASKPDFVISIGDFLTMDSLNAHEGNETFAGRSKPTYAQDLESANLAFDALGSKLNFRPDLHMVEGNHERRIYLFENLHPETNGTMVFQFHKLLERHGWTSSPYGSIDYRGGVGFVHAALNRLGKTYGGKTAENTIANDAVHDIVIGHSHVHRLHRAPKIGGNGYVQVLNVGTALPNNHIEAYAKHALNGWSYGVCEVTIAHNHIQDTHWISMERLGELYG